MCRIELLGEVGVIVKQIVFELNHHARLAYAFFCERNPAGVEPLLFQYVHYGLQVRWIGRIQVPLAGVVVGEVVLVQKPVLRPIEYGEYLFAV